VGTAPPGKSSRPSRLRVRQKPDGREPHAKTRRREEDDERRRPAVFASLRLCASTVFLLPSTERDESRFRGQGRASRICRPSGAWGHSEGSPQLTLWAIVCRCSAPGARSLGVRVLRLWPVRWGRKIEKPRSLQASKGSRRSAIPPVRKSSALLRPTGDESRAEGWRVWKPHPGNSSRPSRLRVRQKPDWRGPHAKTRRREEGRASSSSGEAIECWRSHGKGFCRPSGAGATAWHRVAGFGFVSLVDFVVEQRRRVEPRTAQRARKGHGKDRAIGEPGQVAHNRDAVGFRFGIKPRVGLVPRPTLGWGSQRRWRWWGRSPAA